MWDKGERIGKMLVNMGLVDETQVKEALALSSDNGKSLGQNMFELGHITDSSLLQLLVAQGAASPWFLSKTPAEARVMRLLSPSVMREHMIVPIIRMGDLLLLAVADPKDHTATDRARALTGLRVETVEAEPERIKEVIETILNEERAKNPSKDAEHVAPPAEPVAEAPAPVESAEPEPVAAAPAPVEPAPIKFEKSELGEKPVVPAAPAPPRLTVDAVVVSADDTAPVAGLVDQIIADSVRRNASEILVESTAEGMSVRYRVDGRLRSIGDIPKSLAPLVEARLRLMASLDIIASGAPQSGTVRYQMSSRAVEFDTWTTPTVHGARFIMRARNASTVGRRLEDTGIAKGDLENLRAAMESNEGLLLVVGPSPEERNSSLYSLVVDIASPAREIVTCEDVPGVPISGVSHSKFLHRHERSRPDHLALLLRQSSDAVMIDLMSDERTAAMAVRAALSGRIVFSGLEGKSALSAVTRLTDLGIDPYLAATALSGVLAQRQVRALCPSCRKQEGKVWKSVGCGDCEGTGYKGTVDVFEFLPVNNDLRKLIAAKAPIAEIEAAAKKAGYRPMAEHAATKLERGETDQREIDSTFKRPVADERGTQQTFAIPEITIVKPAEPVKAAAPSSPVPDPEAEDFIEQVRKEREAMNAYFSKQSYEIGGGGFENAA